MQFLALWSYIPTHSGCQWAKINWQHIIVHSFDQNVLVPDLSSTTFDTFHLQSVLGIIPIQGMHPLPAKSFSEIFPLNMFSILYFGQKEMHSPLFFLHLFTPPALSTLKPSLPLLLSTLLTPPSLCRWQ